MNRREKISVLLQEMEYILRRCNGKLPRLWMIASVTAIIVVHVVGSLIVTFPVTETHCQLMLKYQAFRLINVTANNSCKICFRNLLNAHSKSGFQKPYINCKDFRDYLLTCDSIVKGLKDFENVMSLPVLVVVVNNYTELFFGFIVLDPFGRLSEPLWHKPWMWAASFVSLTALISFLGVSLAAASVGEATKNAGDVQQEMMKRIHAHTLHDKVELFIFFKTHKTEPFNLTAGGFFYFTKGFVFAAFGTILTYSLLLVQFT
ncbi:hypothetical protein AVEN_265261-1 [Araneus ventricosus]|uniref:Uncharacterized protein n=1 Tax=Araneus ventricosus TaxID=182803 RepID=A0A4Y2FDK4_ARAVE|nr:hypothetical protein AVEN_265261-1 [Araneus ventricosus]